MPIATATRACPLTHHAARRAQQRAISATVLDLLLDYGDRFVAGGGAEIVRIGQHGRDELARELSPSTWRARLQAADSLCRGGSRRCGGHC